MAQYYKLFEVLCKQGCRASPETDTGAELRRLAGLPIAQGRFGRTRVESARGSWSEVLAMVAADLTRRGEDAAVRARLKTRRQTVRAFLRERYGIFTGPREYWHRENWTPDRADLRDFLRACQRARATARGAA